MKRTYIITFLTCICVFAFSMLWTFVFKRDDDVVIKVEEIVDKILSSNGEPIDKLIAEIDEIVYQIYELTDEEIYVIKQGRC